MSYVIGVFGKISSGKSTFMTFLKGKFDGLFLSADEECRSLYFDDEFLRILRQNFPEIFIEGQVDKRALAKIIFADNKKNELLKSITHPLIKQRLQNKIQKSTKQLVFVEISVFVKDFLNFDELWLLDVEPELQCQRLMQRDNLTRDDAQLRINCQYIPDYCYFDRVIVNNGSLQELKCQIDYISINTK